MATEDAQIKVLYVDDSVLDRELVRDALLHEGDGFELVEAASRAEFEERLAEGPYDVVLSDFNILGFEGLQVLEAVGQRYPQTPVVIVTGTGSEEVAVEAMKRGAADYVLKSPSHVRKLPVTLRSILAQRRLEREQRERIERQITRLTALHQISRALTATLPTEGVLETILRHAVEELGVDAADILLYDEHQQLLEFAAGHAAASEAMRFAQSQLSKGYAGSAVMQRRVVHVPNLLEGADFEDGEAAPDVLGGVIEYYGAPLVAKGQLKGVLEVFGEGALEVDPDWSEFLETIAEQAAIAIDSSQVIESLRESNEELALAYSATMRAGAPPEIAGEAESHVLRVTDLAALLAHHMGLSNEELADIQRGALLHDIARLGVPDRILLAPGSLEGEGWVDVRPRDEVSNEMIAPITGGNPALEIPFCHHERWDGTGYPRGLSGEDIPLSARIFAVVDLWDALRCDRPYRPAWTSYETVKYIESQAGTRFDPKVVEAFVGLVWADR